MVCVALAALVFVSATAHPSYRHYLELGPGEFSGKIDVKLKDGTDFRLGSLASGLAIEGPTGRVLLDLAGLAGQAGAGAGLRLGTRTRRSPIELREESARVAAACRCEVPDLGSYFAIETSADFSSAKRLTELLNASPLVDLAYPVPKAAPRPGDLSPTTPSYVSLQGYLEAAPAGLEVFYAHGVPGGRGGGVKVGDIEWNWGSGHEDLPSCLEVTTLTQIREATDHGDAVLGELFGVPNGYGITGIAPEAACLTATDYSLEGDYNLATAIEAMTDALAAGDVMLLEAQEMKNGILLPVSWLALNYDLIKTATAKGIVVVEAGANGGANLDDTNKWGTAFNRNLRDSGAIMVGAGAPPGFAGQPARSRLVFSSYGSRVDLQGWGGAVYTSGYGDLFGIGGAFSGGKDVRQYYTQEFAGTSSASPMVAGAAASIQGMRKAAGQAPLAPRDLRTLLVATGSAQTGDTSEHIGPQPNLRAAAAALSVCGDGDLEAPEVCDDHNTQDGDGCSAVCDSIETCGNDVVDSAVGEVCDDGNVIDGDGCASDCRSNERCGNGALDVSRGELCDDGNTQSGDGCSKNCKSLEVCGDAYTDVASGEECDDGNTQSGDGCSADCTSMEFCGNGTVDVGELCDDGNSFNDDGCEPDCTLTSTCGNRALEPGESCDDGNTASGDGCSSACKRETRDSRAQPSTSEPDGVTANGEKRGCSSTGQPAAVLTLLWAVATLGRHKRKSQSR